MKILNERKQIELAKALFNEVWSLLDRPQRSPDETARMVHAAHASRFLWDDVGTGTQWARGEWQVSRVYSAVGRHEPALAHAQACLSLCQEHDLSPFDHAFAHEALARGHALRGDADASRHHLERSKEHAAALEDGEERALLFSDLATIG